MNYEIKAGKDGKLTCGGSSNINAGGNHVETAAQIHMNGPAASMAADTPIPRRIPQREPWKHHENLSPASFTPDKTYAVLPDINGNIPADLDVTPELYQKYTTKTDTFAKIKGSEDQG